MKIYDTTVSCLTWKWMCIYFCDDDDDDAMSVSLPMSVDGCLCRRMFVSTDVCVAVDNCINASMRPCWCLCCWGLCWMGDIMGCAEMQSNEAWLFCETRVHEIEMNSRIPIKKLDQIDLVNEITRARLSANERVRYRGVTQKCLDVANKSTTCKIL